MRVAPIALVLVGCGFRGAATVDLAPADLAVTDLGIVPGSDGGTGGGTGPGPRGALPTGFCCGADAECRGRRCAGLGSQYGMCLDVCNDGAICNAFVSAFVCDAFTSLCEPPPQTVPCVDAATFHYGTRRLGECCTPDAAGRAPECEGGWCIRSGPPSNPYYCSQGCTVADPCPAGFTCALQVNGAISDLRQCWPTSTIASSGTYTCD